MKRLIIILAILAMIPVAIFADLTATPASTVFRITDGIGYQYYVIAGTMSNDGSAVQGGFGGVGDTLSTDSTVSRGTLMNIKRIKESNDAGLSELLPIFISSRTQLDSSYLYTKWSSVCWGLNNYYSSVGGLSSWQQARPDSGRFGPYFARVARANGIYLAPKSVFPPGNYYNTDLSQVAANFGSATLEADSVFTYSDSSAIDSSLYGPARIKTVVDYSSGFSVWFDTTGACTGACSLLVFGSNQSLVHARKWAALVNPGGETYLTPAVAGDSLYNIDSAKVKMCGAAFTGNFLFLHSRERADSL